MPSEKDNILEFNQYMKSDECHTLIMLILNLNNPENDSAIKTGGLYLVDIQCQLYWLLIIQETSIPYIKGKIV